MKKVRLVVHLETNGAPASPAAKWRELARSFPELELVRVATQEELERALPEADIAAAWSFPARFYERAPHLRAVITPSAGNESTPPDPSGRVPVIHATFHGILMSETLLALMLFFNRQLRRLLENQAARRWERDYLHASRQLRGQHVLILGYGNIGRRCARLLKGFDCTITGMKRSPRDSRLDVDADAIITYSHLPAALASADHVVLILPGGAETERIITRDHFRAMKRSAYLYNLGRGNCYSEEDLVWALESDLIAGAGLDVFETEPLPPSSRLWELPNVVVLPHASALYPGFMDLFFEELSSRLRELLAADAPV